MRALELARQANARAMAALRGGDAAAAIRELQAAVVHDPAAGALWRNLAHASRIAGDDAQERRALDQALAIDRTDFAAQLRLAQLLQRTGDEQAALQAWDGALQLSAAIGEPAPELVRELEAGGTYCAALRERLADAAAAALADDRAGRTHAEDRRLSAFVDVALGRRRIYHNECAGPHYPFLPADEFFDEAHFPWFADLEAATPLIQAELAALIADGDVALRPYVSLGDGTPENKWSALDRSLDWGACFLYEYGAPNHAVLERCPDTARILRSLPLAQIPRRAPNVFFSLLKPGKSIPPHTGVTNTRAIVHLALDVPPDCGFRVGNDTREWVEGRAFAFDDTIEHEGWNRSDRRRAVLILDVWNPHLSAAECEGITRYLTAADAALSSS